MKMILISFVVLGHIGEPFRDAVYMFHIPAFFFISGYLVNYKKTAKHQIMSVLLLVSAIIIWNIIFIVFNIPDDICLSDKEHILGFIKNSLINVVWCYYPTSQWGHGLICQMWFVWVLAILRIAGLALRDTNLKTKTAILAICVIYTCTINYCGIRTWFYLDRSICALPFFMSGNIAQQWKLESEKLLNWKSITLLAGSFIVLYYANEYINGRNYDMFHLRLGKSVLLYYISAFIGTMLCISLCSLANKERKIVELLSTGTLLILATHTWIDQWIHEYFEFDDTRILETITIMAITLPAIYAANKWCPILLGKTRKHKKNEDCSIRANSIE